MCLDIIIKKGGSILEKDIFGEYLPKEVEYKQFDGKEAAEIVFPTEVNLAFSKKNKKQSRFSPSVIFEKFLDFAENIGEFYVSLIKSILLKLLPVLTVPAVFIGKGVKKAADLLSGLSDKEMRKRIGSGSKLKSDLKHIRLMTLKQEDENKSAYFIKSLKNYIISSLPEEKQIAKAVFNYAFPLVILLTSLFIFFGGNKIFAIKIMHHGETVGYVENQSIYNESKNIIYDMLADENGCRELLDNISFSIERVDVSELSGPDTISETLLNCSSYSYKRACGIYIDGNFLCAIPNESDAAGVFNSVLSPYKKKADSNTTVGFVEEIEYVQGYYPEDSDVIWDSAKLKDCLTNESSPVRVKVMKTSTRTEALKYETVKKNSSTLYKGTKKTTQKGKNGRVQITELTTYIDSKKAYTGIVSEVVIKEPVNEIVLIGTKSNSSASGYAPSRSFIWPTRGAYAISSYYGYRSAYISGRSFHGGIDIVLGYGSSAGIPVVASASGTVVVANSGWRGYGHTVVIDHGNGIRTRYAHMYPGSITVRVGQKVYQGQQIGRIGSTGNSTGPHLHFEVLVNGYKVNPLPYIR